MRVPCVNKYKSLKNYKYIVKLCTPYHAIIIILEVYLEFHFELKKIIIMCIEVILSNNPKG